MTHLLEATVGAQSTSALYAFKGGFPTTETVARAYDAADLNRAVQAYRFFYPNVSVAGMLAGFERDFGFQYNTTYGILKGLPRHLLYTPNSDTPYAAILLDLSVGPIAVELPKGPLLGVANDLNFRWVMDMGLPGPDAGKGGKHLILPPGYQGQIPSGFYTSQSTTNRVFLIIRSLPLGGDMKAALARIETVRIYPLNDPAAKPTWINITDKSGDATPLKWEDNLQFWKVLHGIIDIEPPYEPFREMYGELAVLGIVKGKPFSPDARMKRILEEAAKIGRAQMLVQSFADRRPDRVVWQDRKWEWATLVPENGFFDAPTHVDVDAREKWFYQATFESPAMFRRQAGGGSVYWFGARDKEGAYVEGAKTYRLRVPTPVPASLFWSVTVYDPDTRSEIQTDQGHAALRSLFELKDELTKLGTADGSTDLYFGPAAPAGKGRQWIKTVPGKGWFVYFRLYGPQAAAFDGSWKPGDFEEVNRSWPLPDIERAK